MGGFILYCFQILCISGIGIFYLLFSLVNLIQFLIAMLQLGELGNLSMQGRGKVAGQGRGKVRAENKVQERLRQGRSK